MYCESQSLQGTVAPRRAKPPSLPGTFLFALCTKPLSECPRFLSCLSQQSWQADTCSSSCWGAGSLPPARREPQTPLPVPSLALPTLDPEGRDREALNVRQRSMVGPGAHQTTPFPPPTPPRTHLSLSGLDFVLGFHQAHSLSFSFTSTHTGVPPPRPRPWGWARKALWQDRHGPRGPET